MTRARRQGEPALKTICPCQATDAELRVCAKRMNVPLRWLRGIKKLHRQFKLHELFNESMTERAGAEGEKR